MSGLFGGSSSGNTTTTQKFEPPENTKGGWDAAVNQAGTLFSKPFQQYDGPRIAPLNDLQNTGLQMAVDRGMNGAPDLNSARQSNLLTSSGAYLNAGNPYLDPSRVDSVVNDNAQNMIQAAQLGPMAQTDAAAARAGAFGGSAYNQLQSGNTAALTKSIGQMANSARLDYSNLGASTYENERNRMLQANSQAPAMAADDWKSIQAVTGAGDAYNSNDQRQMDQMYQDFQTQNNFPQQQLQNFLSVLSQASGTYGGGGMATGTQSLPGMSPLASLLGFGAGAYGVSQMIPR